MKKIFLLFLTLMLFMNAVYAAEDDVVAMRTEWQKEVLSDLDKTYGLYACMPWKDFLGRVGKLLTA